MSAPARPLHSENMQHLLIRETASPLPNPTADFFHDIWSFTVASYLLLFILSVLPHSPHKLKLNELEDMQCVQTHIHLLTGESFSV